MTAEQARRRAERIKRRKQRGYPRRLRKAVEGVLKSIRHRIAHYPDATWDTVDYSDLVRLEVDRRDVQHELEKRGYVVEAERSFLTVRWRTE